MAALAVQIEGAGARRFTPWLWEWYGRPLISAQPGRYSFNDAITSETKCSCCLPTNRWNSPPLSDCRISGGPMILKMFTNASATASFVFAVSASRKQNLPPESVEPDAVARERFGKWPKQGTHRRRCSSVCSETRHQDSSTYRSSRSAPA